MKGKKGRFRPLCKSCKNTYSIKRKRAGYEHCMPCGEGVARETKHTIVPMNKSNYVVVTNLADLKGLCNKGGWFTKEKNHGVS